jgi:hypothetical protein
MANRDIHASLTPLAKASVSAIVIHHPDAKYFSLSPADIECLERELDTPSSKTATA